jgi:hypothetical protein
MKFSAALLALALVSPTVLSAQENQPAGPTDPAEIEALRRAVAAAEAAEVASPEDIERLRQLELDAEAARNAPGYANDARFNMRTRRVDLISDGQGTPHRTIDMVLAEGIISSVAFYDHTGQPWPVQSVAFDRSRVAVNNDGCEGQAAPMSDMGNVIVLSPCAFWTTTNLQVLLSGESRPIPFAISSGTREADIQVDGLVTVALQSDAARPFGRDRLGNLDTSWVRPVSRTLTIDPIDYSNGGTYPVFVAPGVTTDIGFMDGNRQPWPIAEIAFAPGIVAVNGPCDEEAGGVKTIAFDGEDQPTTMYLTPCQDTTATVSVRMAGRAGALSLVITPARSGIVQPDGTLSIVVPGNSPYRAPATAATAAGPGAPSYRTTPNFTHDRFLDEFLFGTPPQGATRAIITGGQGIEGWVFDGALYIRGAFTVLNPAYDANAQSREGTLSVYKYGPPVSRILATDASGREFVLSITY